MKRLNKKPKSGLQTVKRYACGCGCLNILFWTNSTTTNMDAKNG